MEETSNQIKPVSDGFRIENIHRASTDNFTKSSLSLIFPKRIIKRILYRPYLGSWYPYIDLFEPNKELQLTLFYGPINLVFTPYRICALCGKDLKKITGYKAKGKIEEKSNRKKPKVSTIALPISLCDKCRREVYYSYWDCFSKLIEYSFQNFCGNRKETEEISNMSVKNVLCQNFLEPRCGFPKDSEMLNPCLEDYGIGLMMTDTNTLKIVIGPMGTLKYQMIWQGGLFGVILGRHNRIINLQILAGLLPKFARHLRKSLNELNIESKSLEYQIENFASIEIAISTGDKIKKESNSSIHIQIAEWLIFAFFNFYNTNDAQTILNLSLLKPVSLLKQIMIEISKNVDLEILEFINIFEKFPPFCDEFRKYIAEYLNHFLLMNNLISKHKNVDMILKVLLNLATKQDSNDINPCMEILRKMFLKITQNFLYLHSYQLNELELYQILASLGPFIIARTNISHEPSIIHINEIIGRLIF